MTEIKVQKQQKPENKIYCKSKSLVLSVQKKAGTKTRSRI